MPGENCPYCGIPLRQGKGGNTRGCMVCEKLICVNCTKYGICKTHLDPSNTAPEMAFKLNYRNYWIGIILGIIIPLVLMQIANGLISPYPEYAIGLSLLIIGMFPTAIILVIVIRKQFVQKAKRIFQRMNSK